MLRRMDAAQALADLIELSSQVEQAAIVGADATVLASTFADEARASRFADGVRRLVEEAEQARAARGLQGLGQLEAATVDGSVFVVREGQRLIGATTRAEPTVGLVFYDLKHCLRSVEEPTSEPEAAPEPPKRKRAPRKKPADASA
jgi:predicted regulator of Ras-like GTPase activity (Roadblock/LC7/MglB family)